MKNEDSYIKWIVIVFFASTMIEEKEISGLSKYD